MTALMIIGGLLLVLFGANALVEGAGNIARKLGMSEFLIGLTIVGIGTSSPEMVVSFISAAKGSADMAVGNIVGSNIFNILMILGITAVIRPLKISSNNLRRDVSMTIFSSLLLFLPFLFNAIGLIDNVVITRWMGIVFLAFFAFYMYMCFKNDRNKEDNSEEANAKEIKPSLLTNHFVSVLLIAVGLAGLIYGGQLFVDGASAFASSLGVSDSLIAITVLAGGTSLPELATCVVAAAKRKGDLALGNILGSNISNVLLILGGSSLITPLGMTSITAVDMAAVLVASLLVAVSAFTFKRSHLDRIEGIIFILVYCLYMAYLIGNI